MGRKKIKISKIPDERNRQVKQVPVMSKKRCLMMMTDKMRQKMCKSFFSVFNLRK